jgi:hypothetical protein
MYNYLLKVKWIPPLFIMMAFWAQSNAMDTLKVIGKIRKDYSFIQSISSYDSVKYYSYKTEEGVPADNEALYFFYYKGALQKCIRLFTGSGEGGIENVSRMEIFYNGQKPFFIFTQHFTHYLSKANIEDDLCIREDKCMLYGEKRYYFDSTSNIIQCLVKKTQASSINSIELNLEGRNPAPLKQWDHPMPVHRNNYFLAESKEATILPGVHLTTVAFHSYLAEIFQEPEDENKIKPKFE